MRGTKFLLYVIIVLVHAIIFAATRTDVKYTWSEFDERWDCVVGIAIGNKPIGTGVFITTNTVLTSANVIEDYVNRKRDIVVYAINGKFNSSIGRMVKCISGPFGLEKHRKGSQHWVKQGYTNDNSPAHDIYTLALHRNQEDKLNKNGAEIVHIASLIKGYYKKGRYPFMVVPPYITHTLTNRHYMFAGFGFVDKKHVKTNTFLEIESYGEEPVLTNCDQWIIRSWGYFICIRNVGNTVGVPSGAPLFNKGVLVGIGSFTFQRGNDSIHVFTDLSVYIHNMQTCVNLEYFINFTNIYAESIIVRYYGYTYNRQGIYVKSLDYK